MMANGQSYDVAIIGGGIAGLSVALRLPEHLRVALFTKGQLGESNTRYAQGGLAVALGEDDDPELHFQDTIAAGAGLCDEEAVRILVEQAPAAVQWLIAMGVRFDRAQPGDEHATRDGLLLGREAAHSRWRVLHAGGDATGAEIERALMVALRKRSSIELYEETFVSRLVVEDGTCIGLEAIDREGHAFPVNSGATVLASGGAGGLWLHTSNPAGATADGLALAWQAGAAVTDLEFMQFHPTVLVAGGSSHLISEAVRGEGAYLRNHAGERFMPKYSPQAELAPRDVVARSILNEMLAEETDCQYLDLRHLPAQRMHERFPTISAICRGYGLDLATDLLPVAPAAHYCMGGVKVDTHGRTTVDGLYAVGEVSCTGVHGANRLASNSLLEGLVFGLRLADRLPIGADLSKPSRPVGTGGGCGNGRGPGACPGGQTMGQDGVRYQGRIPTDTLPTLVVKMHDRPRQKTGTPAERSAREIRSELRHIMWKYVSLRRDAEGLIKAKRHVDALRNSKPGRPEEEKMPPEWLETENMLNVAELVIEAALRRCESRGSHWRSDFPEVDETLAGYHYVLQRTWGQSDEIARNGQVEDLRVLASAIPGPSPQRR